MRTIDYKGTAKITIIRANAIVATRRSVLAFRGSAQDEEAEEAIRVLRTITYPDLTSPVSKAEGFVELEDGSRISLDTWPISFENFCLIPDGLLLEWETAVYAENPHWSPLAAATDEEQEKKIEKSTDA